MMTRSVLLLASAAALGLSTSAAAQEGHHEAPQDEGRHAEHIGARHHASEQNAPELHADTVLSDGRYDGAWQGAWSDEETWRGEWTGTYTDTDGHTVDTDYHGVFIGENAFMSDDGHMLSRHGDSWRQHHVRGGAHRGNRGPRLAYTAEERAQWLNDCQYLMADGGGYFDDNRGRDGGLIGGLLGAVVGGVAGNRIADNDRLLGTVVGAGLGGLAGTAIGSVLDGNGDGEFSRNEIWASRYCEAYLRRHELGGGEFANDQQIMMVSVGANSRFVRSRAHGHEHGDSEDCRVCREEVIEEEIEIERPAPRPRPVARPAPRPQGKLTPLN